MSNKEELGEQASGPEMMSDEQRKEYLESEAEKRGISANDMREIDRLISTKMSEWPPEINDYIKDHTKELGISGDVLVDTLTEYFKEKSTELQNEK